MNPKPLELDVDYIGSQDPALQPTEEDFAAISRFIQEQKKQQAAEAAAEKPVRAKRKTVA